MKKKAKKIPYKLIGGLSGALLAALGLVLLGYYLTQLPEADFVARTTVRGLMDENPDLAGQVTEFQELQIATEEWANARLSQPLTLESERGNIDTSLANLGYTVDWSTLDPELKNFMQEAGPFEKIKTILFGRTIELEMELDEASMDQVLTQSGIEQGNKNAAFIWDGKTVSIDPGQTGYGIEKELLRENLASQLTAANFASTVPLTLLSSEAEITEAELQAILPSAQELATKTVTFQDEFGNTWDLELSTHLNLIVPTENGPMASNEYLPWTLDETGFITYAESILVPEVEEAPTGVVITQNADGSYAFEGSARFGKELDKMALYETVLEKLTEAPAPSPENPEEIIDPLAAAIPLPITTVEPSVTVPDALAEKGVTGLVGLGYSDFSGSPVNRVHNIQTGIAQYNGVLIEQGAEFSFMGQMSPVDAEHGFLPELVIKGDETIPEYGGGLCQISSTMFRAALYSGLPITARRNHSYAVSYYARPFGYGLDATVYDPLPDLKFVNDTPGALLVQAYTEGNSAYYVFYGTNDGRTVTMEGPYSYNYNTVDPETTYTDKLAPGERELKEYSHTGFTTDWYRTVTYTTTEASVDEDGNILYVSPYAATASGVKELIHSVYEARPAKYWEGAAEGTDSEE